MNTHLGRALAWFCRVSLRWPNRVMLVAGVITVLGAAYAVRIPVSTSRSGLVSADDPQQQRMLAYEQRFGRPDAPAFVITGGDADARRAVAAALIDMLEQDQAFAGRVLGRMSPNMVADVAALQLAAQGKLPPDAEPETLGALLAGGLPAWVSALSHQVEAGLEGDVESDVPPEQAFAGMATLLRTLKGALGHETGNVDVGALLPKSPGVDAAGFFTTADGRALLVLVFPVTTSDEGQVLAPMVAALRAARDTALTRVGQAGKGVTADLTGLPALAVDELSAIEVGLQRSSVATTIGILLLCVLLFASFRQGIVALLPLLPGVALTIALTRLLYGHLSLVTSSFVAVLLGLGIDFSVHLVTRFNEERAAAQSPEAAAERALRFTGPSVLMGAVVTAAAFLSTVSTDFTGYAELGVVTASGLGITVVATFVLLPPLLRRSKGRVSLPIHPQRLVGLLRKLRVPVVVAAGAVAALGAVALHRGDIAFNPRYFDFLPGSTESARALDVLERDPLASPVFANVTAASVDEARARTEALRNTASVAAVLTPTDLLPAWTAPMRAQLDVLARIPQADLATLAKRTDDVATLVEVFNELAGVLDEARFAARGTAAEPAAQDAVVAAREVVTLLETGNPALAGRVSALYTQAAALAQRALGVAANVMHRGAYAPSDIPALFAKRFVSRDGQALTMFVTMKGDPWDPANADAFAADVRAVDPQATGLALIHVEHGRMIVQGFRRAAVIAAVLIVLLLVIDFRSAKDTMLALVPTAVGWLWMLAAMAACGMRFDVANVVALPLVLGIGIAFGVHFMHRVREAGAQGLMVVIGGTGSAILASAATTIVGFAGLMLGQYGAMKSLGGVMVLGIASCLLATVVVLPAVLVLVRRVEA